jgi:hypothetical protein
VKKFIHDVEKNECCGLFLAQNYGIANKENFQIDISGKNVLLYLHEVNNDAEKIRVAISIIDHFKNKLDEFDNNAEVDTISKDVLDMINREYRNHAIQKMNMIKLIKECNQKMIKQMEEIKIPSLEDYLSTRYASSTSKFTCKYCGFVGKNQGSMSAHWRGCAVRKTMEGEMIETNDEEEDTFLSKFIDNKETYITYSSKINKIKHATKDFLVNAKKEGKSIAGFGASVTGTTLIYHFEIGEYLDFLVDDNPAKQGLFSPGLHIPVFPTTEIYNRKPDYIILLAWRFADSIIKENRSYIDNGGYFLVPIPEFTIC